MKILRHKTTTFFDRDCVASSDEVTSTMLRLELNNNSESVVKASRSDHPRKRLKH